MNGGVTIEGLDTKAELQQTPSPTEALQRLYNILVPEVAHSVLDLNVFSIDGNTRFGLETLLLLAVQPHIG